MENPKKLIIRTSDRADFRRCRLLWNFGSKIRLNYEPSRARFYYDFGEAWHAALAQWYEPSQWDGNNSPVERAIEAKIIFESNLLSKLTTYRDRGIDDMEMEREFDDALELGPKMLDNYIPWSLEHDDFTPVRVEQEFEVQIGWYCQGVASFPGGHDNDYEPCEHCIPVMYQGRVDALVQDFLGNYWIGEWKSADKAPQVPNRWLQMDSQSGSYIWSLQKMLGIPIKGVIHRTTIKHAPESPRLLKNNQLSIDRRQYTNVKLFKESMQQRAQLIPITEAENIKYREYLDYLGSPDAPQFIYEEKVTRNPNQIENIGKWITVEAREMLNDPDIYPNPNQFNCNGCPFYGVSLAWQEGSDWQFILDSQFVKRTDEFENTVKTE